MSGKQISLIYFYLISAASLALIVVGIFNIVNFGINITQYDKYPLRYQPFDCNYPSRFGSNFDGLVPAMPMGATPSAKEQQMAKEKCEVQLSDERKKQKLDDLKAAATFTIVGAILFLIHFPQARKNSKT